MAYRDYVSEVVGTIPKLPYPLAQKLVNRSWNKIRNSRMWSFLIGYGDIISPASVSAGSVTVTLGSTTVNLDATAAAALSPLAFANPPLAGDFGVGRQFRVNGTGSNGPVYSILSADFGALTLTLDRAYTGPTLSGAAYSVYRCYYSPPSTDFLRYITVTNMNSGYTIRGRNLYLSQDRLNSIDPQRGGTGDAYRISSFRVGSTGLPVDEWYPHPVNSAVYNCIYQKRGTDLSPTVDIPVTFPEMALISLALAYGAEWALANVATFPELQQTNWVMFRQQKLEMYRDELMQAIRQDDEIIPHLPFTQGSSPDFPMGGEFLQSHDVSSFIGG